MLETDTGVTYRIQVIGFYATRWRHRGWESVEPLGIELGRLAEFYESFRGQLPRRIGYERLAVEDVRCTPSHGAALSASGITDAALWLFALPSDQVVAAVVLDILSPDLNADPALTVQLLEACAYSQIEIRDSPIATHIGAMAAAAGAWSDDGASTLPAERYQVVFAQEIPGRQAPDEHVVSQILYRIDPPYRQEFMRVERPKELNQEARAFCAVTPYVSVLFGHPEYVRNSVFLSTVQAVGTAARFQEIWHLAYQHVQKFRETAQATDVGKQRRSDLEELVDELGNLELDLSFSVETPADLGLLIPSLRIESFHRELYTVMELPTRAKTVSQMFVRLDSSIKSELRAIDIRERREEEEKRLHAAIAVSALSMLGVPLGFLVAFFGINATQVDSDRSIFDFAHYSGAYVAAGVLALVPVLVFVLLYSRAWLRTRQERRGRP